MTMEKGFTIPYEAVDSITLANLIEMRDEMKKDISDHEVDGKYMHGEDYDLNKNTYLPALNIVIEYMGGR